MVHLTIQQVQPEAVVTSTKREPQKQPHTHIKTEQMYRNYMKTGSIYYDSSGKQYPESKVIVVTTHPLSQKEIQKAAKAWLKKQE